MDAIMIYIKRNKEKVPFKSEVKKMQQLKFDASKVKRWENDAKKGWI